MVPIDSNGFGASFTPNPDCSCETWKRLYSRHTMVRCRDMLELRKETLKYRTRAPVLFQVTDEGEKIAEYFAVQF